MFVAGIDAHATYSVIAIVSNTGQLVHGPVRINNTEEERLHELFEPYRPLEVVVETSPAWPWLFDRLEGGGIQFVLAHAKAEHWSCGLKKDSDDSKKRPNNGPLSHESTPTPSPVIPNRHRRHSAGDHGPLTGFCLRLPARSRMLTSHPRSAKAFTRGVDQGELHIPVPGHKLRRRDEWYLDAGGSESPPAPASRSA